MQRSNSLKTIADPIWLITVCPITFHRIVIYRQISIPQYLTALVSRISSPNHYQYSWLAGASFSQNGITIWKRNEHKWKGLRSLECQRSNPYQEKSSTRNPQNTWIFLDVHTTKLQKAKKKKTKPIGRRILMRMSHVWAWKWTKNWLVPLLLHTVSEQHKTNQQSLYKQRDYLISTSDDLLPNLQTV